MTSSSVAVALHARRAQHLDERRQVALDPQLEHAAGRPFQLRDRPLRGDLALVHDDHVIAGELDVGQQVRRQDQVDVLVVARGRE